MSEDNQFYQFLHNALDNIMAELREQRQDIKELHAEMASKEDLKALNDQIDAQVAKCARVEVAEGRNTEFREFVTGGTKWLLGSLLVALFGLFGSLAVASSHSVPQTVVSAPKVIVAPIVRTVEPPQPGVHK